MKKEINNTDVKLLRSYISRCGFSITDVAKMLNITYVALNAKMQQKYAFTLNEALQLKRILNLDQEEWNAVFDGEVAYVFARG